MIFASLTFVFGFLPLFLLVYHLTPGLRRRNLVLTLASYVFYGWWKPSFVLLMLLSTAVDWFCSLRMGAAHERRGRTPWLVVSLVVNLGLLGWFKYANLVVDTVESVASVDLGWQDVVLPVGISFYTFQSMSYSIDVWRGTVRPVRSFADLACYVAMFPQLVAGPIVRYRDVQEQLVQRRETFGQLAVGCQLFAIGMVKKVLIADQAARIADPVFAMAAPGLAEAWIGTTAYAVQILFDFSGYSDMAVGLGAMLGFRLPRNFDSPYVSRSITEFWRRWHISLSSWLRDYLYVPLGGNRRGELRTYANLAATMLLGGLWHGAAWTFVLWGAYQGAFLVFERARGRRAPYAFLPGPLQVLVTFAIVLGGWAIFRAEGTAGLAAIFGGLGGFHGLGELPAASARAFESWAGLLIGMAVAWFAPDAWRVVGRGRPWAIAAIGVLFVVALAELAASTHRPFLYFQF